MTDWNNDRDLAATKANESLRESRGNLILHLEDLDANPNVSREDKQAILKGFDVLSGKPPTQLVAFFTGQQPLPRPAAAQQGLPSGQNGYAADPSQDRDELLLYKEVVPKLLGLLGLPDRELRSKLDLQYALQEANAAVKAIRDDAVQQANNGSAVPNGHIAKRDVADKINLEAEKVTNAETKLNEASGFGPKREAKKALEAAEHVFTVAIKAYGDNLGR